ncbi:MAG: cell division protein SepF [Lachnospiraceae bacterium]|nr:cell division protein SepF [Lachnospiraceae bacterium]
MGIFDKMLDAMKLGDEDDYDDYDDDYEDDEDYEETEKKSLFKRSSDDASEKKSQNSGATVSRFPTMRGGKKTVSSSMEVCVIKPSSFEDAREIAETLLADRTVILNMEGLELGLAQRIIDFISGSCYAIDGNLQKVSNYIFIITPSNVDISGDLQEIMSAFDFSGIQTGF